MSEPLTHREQEVLALLAQHLTYQEIGAIFKRLNIKPNPNETQPFDLAHKETRLYPISGGLAQSAGLIDRLTDEEYDVISGPALVQKALENFRSNPRIKLLDVLFCAGGCIAGQGIISRQPIKSRREKVITHWIG